MTQKQPDKLRLTSLSQLDQRTTVAKETVALAAAIERDIGGDPSAAMRVLIEQTACVAALCGDYARRYLAGELPPDEVGSWLSATNNLRRLSDTVGLERRSKEISLNAYLEAKAAAAPPEAQETASQDEDDPNGDDEPS
jgi:hypothetical protein